jgi:hypothetical protein
MADYDRMVRLFGYEWDNGRDSILWQEPKYFSQAGGQSGRMLDDGLDEWKAQKRAFTRDEVLQGQWIKVADIGNRCIVRFHSDGTLTETDLFNKEASWHGQWQLVGAVLRVNIGKYELDIVANKEGAIHSGIEFESGRYQPNAYFKVIHLM